MFGFLKKQIHEPVRLQKEDLAKLHEPIRILCLNGEDCDQVTGAYGAFGSATNPIPVNGDLGEIKYIGKLLGKTSKIQMFHRIGSTSSQVCEHSVDVFEIVSIDGTQWNKLYFDFYHPRRSNLTPLGYTLKPYDKSLKMDIPFAYGVNSLVSDFPYGLPEAIIDFYGDHPGSAFARHARKWLAKVSFERPVNK